MPDSTVLSVRISTETKEKLARIAKRAKRSQSFLAAEAIEEYVAVQEWQIAGIAKAVEEADAGGPMVSNDAIKDWIASWGTDDEKEPPEPDIRRK